MSLHFLDNLFQLCWHFWNGLAPHLYPVAGAFLQDDVHLPQGGVLVRIVLAEVSAAAFLSFERRSSDGFGDGEQVAQVERGVPAGVEFAISGHADRARAPA